MCRSLPVSRPRPPTHSHAHTHPWFAPCIPDSSLTKSEKYLTQYRIVKRLCLIGGFSLFLRYFLAPYFTTMDLSKGSTEWLRGEKLCTFRWVGGWVGGFCPWCFIQLWVGGRLAGLVVVCCALTSLLCVGGWLPNLPPPPISLPPHPVSGNWHLAWSVPMVRTAAHTHTLPPPPHTHTQHTPFLHGLVHGALCLEAFGRHGCIPPLWGPWIHAREPLPPTCASRRTHRTTSRALPSTPSSCSLPSSPCMRRKVRCPVSLCVSVHASGVAVVWAQCAALHCIVCGHVRCGA